MSILRFDNYVKVLLVGLVYGFTGYTSIPMDVGLI